MRRTPPTEPAEFAAPTNLIDSRAWVCSLSHPKIFRIGELGSPTSASTPKALATGFAALDDELHGRGWQQPGLSEILCDHTGVGEFSMLMKSLGSATMASRSDGAQHVMWVLSPGQAWVPYAPALAQSGISLESLVIVRTKKVEDAFWAAEQGLKSGTCRAVLLRVNENYCSPLSLRRLLQAAIAGGSVALLLRPLAAASSPSPAGTRIALHPEADGVLRVELLKRRGLPPGKSVKVAARSLACLRRESEAVHVKASSKSNADPRPDWLENVVSGTALKQVKLRAHLLDPNRR